VKDYLGDSVYAEYDGAAIILTTQNEDAPSNTIVLELDTLAALQRFLARADMVAATPAPVVTSDDPYGLLAYNAFLVANPEHAAWPTCFVFCHDADDFANKVRTLGKCSKGSAGGYLNADRWFGRVHHQVTISQQLTCERRQVGTKPVTKLVPAVEVEMVEVTVEEPIMEWVCPQSFLALGNGGGGR